jgi:hypothetical protein
LRDEPKVENKDLRIWGIQIINKYSGIQLTKELRDDLATKTRFPSEKFKLVKRLVIKSVSPYLVSEINRLLMESGAIQVEIHMEKGKGTEITAVIPDEAFQSISKQISEILKRAKRKAPN